MFSVVLKLLHILNIQDLNSHCDIEIENISNAQAIATSEEREQNERNENYWILEKKIVFLQCSNQVRKNERVESLDLESHPQIG